MVWSFESLVWSLRYLVLYMIDGLVMKQTTADWYSLHAMT
jgi:hypothetical protein